MRKSIRFEFGSVVMCIGKHLRDVVVNHVHGSLVQDAVRSPQQEGPLLVVPDCLIAQLDYGVVDRKGIFGLEFQSDHDFSELRISGLYLGKRIGQVLQQNFFSDKVRLSTSKMLDQLWLIQASVLLLERLELLLPCDQLQHTVHEVIAREIVKRFISVPLLGVLHFEAVLISFSVEVLEHSPCNIELVGSPLEFLPLLALLQHLHVHLERVEMRPKE